MRLAEAREHYGVREWGLRAPLAVRLLRGVVEDDGCWIWTGARSDGYGRVRANGSLALAHRVSYELFVGPVPVGLHLDHLCRRRDCVSPGCLEPVTQAENTRRGAGPTAINSRKAACIRGHRFTEDTTVLRGGRRYCAPCVQIRNERRSA